MSKYSHHGLAHVDQIDTSALGDIKVEPITEEPEEDIEDDAEVEGLLEGMRERMTEARESFETLGRKADLVSRMAKRPASVQRLSAVTTIPPAILDDR